MTDGTKRSNILQPVIAVLGCGSLGTALVRGLLSAAKPVICPERVLLTVISQSSAVKLCDSLCKEFKDRTVDVFEHQNVVVASQSDVIILACPPKAMHGVLRQPGMREALSGKVLISVLAGVSTRAIIDAIYDGDSKARRCYVVRALPNLAVALHSSATAVEEYDEGIPSEHASLVTAIFEQLGGVVHLPAALMDASTVTCGSTPAFIALFVDGLIDGAVAAGIPRDKADAMMAQVLASTSALLQHAGRASLLRESICAMPGCTIQGNLVLEKGGIRGTAAEAMKSAVEAAQQLG